MEAIGRTIIHACNELGGRAWQAVVTARAKGWEGGRTLHAITHARARDGRRYIHANTPTKIRFIPKARRGAEGSR